jgi:hypothetical protein
MFNIHLTLHPTGRPILSFRDCPYIFQSRHVGVLHQLCFLLFVWYIQTCPSSFFITQIWMRQVLPNHSSHFPLHIFSDILLLQIFKWIILFEVWNDLSSSSYSEYTALQSPWVLATVCRRAHLQKLFTHLYSSSFSRFCRCYTDATERVPWIVGMTALEASHSQPIAVFPSNPRWRMSADQSVC